ncbi:MAG: hypothetical protein KKE94_18200 [Gammaproteobacteria bacterium]|nr:hypothetical protein [Gammaproteobacteria bacterium]
MSPKLIIILLVLLAGCTNTKVHLYTKYLSEEEIQEVTKELENKNFTVIKNTLSIPDSVNESSVIYSPFLINRDHLSSALDSLSKLGWAGIRLENFVKGNHWYGKNNFGLILLPEGLIRSDLKINEELSQRYVGTDCDAQVEIELYSNNSYSIKYRDGNKMITKNGSWKVSGYPYLELSDENGLLPMYFQAVKRTEQDLINKIDIIEIKPIQNYQIFSDCKFSHGVRH